MSDSEEIELEELPPLPALGTIVAELPAKLPEKARIRLAKQILREKREARGELEASRAGLRRRLRIEHLWVNEGRAAKEIADDVGLTVKQVQRIVYDNPGWELRRMEVEGRMKAAVEDPAKAGDALTQEIVAEIGSRSAELAIGALEMGRDKVAAGDAQGLNYAASAARTFTGLFRQARGLGADGNGEVGGALPLVMLVGNFAVVGRQEKQAEPVEVTGMAEEPWGFD